MQTKIVTRLSAATLLLFGWATAVQSQGLSERETKDKPLQISERLGALTVTATRTATDVDDVSRSVSVVRQERIQSRQAADVLPLLRELPGVSSASNGGLAGQLILRGFSTQGFRAPLFIDGDRFRGRNTIEYSFFNPDQIERIEVVRGPASSLYGTDSFGGIINIITKRAMGDVSGPWRFTANEASFEYASAFNRYAAHAQVGGVGHGFDVLLSGSFRDADKYNSPVGDIPNASFSTPGLNFRGGYTFAPGQRLELTARYVSIERERAGGQFAAPGAANTDPATPQREQDDVSNRERYLRLLYEGESLLGGRIHDVEASLYRRNLDTHVNVVPDNRNPSTFVDVYVVGPTVTGGRLKGLSDVTPNLTLTYGTDWYFEDRRGSERSTSGGQRAQSAPDTDQLSIGIFSLAQWQVLDSLRLDASVRYDHIRTRIDPTFIEEPTIRTLFKDAGETENNPITGGIGAIWQVTDVASLFGNISSAFRAPSVTEIAAVGDGVNAQFRVPNPNIDPERAINYETGLRLRWRKVQTNITGFINELDDLIDRDAPTTFNGTDALQIQNIGKARVSGVETEIIWFPSNDWLVRANATYTRGEDTQNNRPLPQIPPWNGLLAARWEPSFDGFYVRGAMEWALKQNRIDTTQERKTNGYAIFNIEAGYELHRTWPKLAGTTLRFSLENLFDKKYRLHGTPEDIRFAESPSNPLVEAGRGFIVGIDTKF